MPRPILLLFAFALGLALPASARAQLDSGDRSRGQQERAYQDCMILARAAPAAALDSALGWAARGGGDGARHCAAVALIGLGQYRDAAQRLERLAADLHAGDLHAGDPALGLDVLAQAGQAWNLAGDTTRAHAVQSAALRIDPDNVELLLDRAITLATTKNYWEAVDDLNRALDLAPGRSDLLTLRASAYRSLDAIELAREDIALALAQAPNSPDALLERGILRHLEGDEPGARDDWLRVIGLAEGTPSAESARANLEQLDGNLE